MKYQCNKCGQEHNYFGLIENFESASWCRVWDEYEHYTPEKDMDLRLFFAWRDEARRIELRDKAIIDYKQTCSCGTKHFGLCPYCDRKEERL